MTSRRMNKVLAELKEYTKKVTSMRFYAQLTNNEHLFRMCGGYIPLPPDTP